MGQGGSHGNRSRDHRDGGGDGGPSLKVRGGSTEIATVQISSGATFAYLLLKPKWDANQQKNWKKIEDWEDDQWSLF
jgi:hypothetical protein